MSKQVVRRVGNIFKGLNNYDSVTELHILQLLKDRLRVTLPPTSQSAIRALGDLYIRKQDPCTVCFSDYSFMSAESVPLIAGFTQIWKPVR
jgi:hypothetical protein